MEQITIALIVFFAIFTQTVVGFGSAMIAMPLLASLVTLPVAAPLFALVGGTAEMAVLYRYRASLNLHAVSRLSVASIFGVPLGVWALSKLDDALVLQLLGGIITTYALYSLFRPTLPQLYNPRWAYGFGFLGGILTGAYNMSGPPVIIYGNASRWQREEFKCNLQGYFLLNSITVFVAHLWSHHYTSFVLESYLVAIPAVALAVVAGLLLDRYVNPDMFRKLVLILLLVLGLRFVLGI